jgi:long-subunit fatty acid transport protein
MRKSTLKAVFKSILAVIILFFSCGLFAQGQSNTPQPPNDFWRNVQFGGGIGLSIGSGYTNITLAPSAIYTVNPVVAVGLGLQLGYASEKNYYTSFVYGASAIGLINPIPQIQLSVELEETNANTDYKSYGSNFSENYWNTALYLGGGYQTGNVTVGVRYDVLFDANKSYYGDAFMPFVRVYF